MQPFECFGVSLLLQNQEIFIQSVILSLLFENSKMMLSQKSVWDPSQPRHPSQSISQVTILRLDQNLYDSVDLDVDSLIQAKYNEQERKHIIVNRTGGKIIDSRTISNIDDFTMQPSCKPLQIVEKKYPMEDSQMEYIIQRIDDSRGPSNSKLQEMYHNPIKTEQWQREKGSILKSLWEDNWKELDKLHQQFLQTIVKNQPETFTNILDRKNYNIVIDINYRYQSNWTALHFAAMKSSIQIFSRLVNHPRIDINALTDFGQTPLHIATKANKMENCLLLLSAGVCFDQRDQDLNTALHYAAELGYKDISEALVTHGASYLIKNSNGMTAVDLASNYVSMANVFHPLNQQAKPVDIDPLYRNRTNHRTMVEKMLNLSILASPELPQETKKVLSKQKKQKDKLSSRKQNIFKMYQFIKEQHKVETITLSSFKFYKRIGEGAFGEVYLVKKEGKDKFFALKAIRKERVFGTSLYRYIQTEKEILSLINHPFIVKLRYAFQTQTYLFLVMDYCEGGDLSKLLQKRKKFEQKYVRSYACQILLGIQALHKNKILYRDLKPQNIVLDKDGHALITDFGLSKKMQNLDEINKSFCGTPAYLPLEIINKKGHNRMADWYQFGIVLYQLYTGLPPFYADTKAELYDIVRAGVIRFPKNTPQIFRDLIKRLLSQNPQKRLGAQKDAQSIKQHPWFNDVDWQAVLDRKMEMPPIENKLKIGQPIKTKFHDVKSEKFQLPMWSFIS